MKAAYGNFTYVLDFTRINSCNVNQGTNSRPSSANDRVHGGRQSNYRALNCYDFYNANWTVGSDEITAIPYLSFKSCGIGHTAIIIMTVSYEYLWKNYINIDRGIDKEQR